MADTTKISENGVHQKQKESLLQEKQSKPAVKLVGFKIQNIPERLKDSKYRKKLQISWLVAAAYFSMGLTVGLTGATLLDLQIITGTDLKRASAFVTGNTGGYMAGCLTGGIIFSQLDSSFLLFVSVFGMGSTLIATPFCSSYILMILMRAVCGFFAACINTSMAVLGTGDINKSDALNAINHCIAHGYI